MPALSPAQVAEMFFAAYNAGDIDATLAACTPDVFIIRHNGGAATQGRNEFGALLRKFGSIMPGKHFANRRGLYVDGDKVVIEHTWYGTAVEDAPGIASKGEQVSCDLCSVLTIRDGLVAACHDYG